MTVAELRELLTRKAVPAGAYRLEDGGAGEAYILDREGREWVVYYSERGLRTEERRFQSEDEACADILDRLSRSFHFLEDDDT